MDVATTELRVLTNSWQALSYTVVSWRGLYPVYIYTSLRQRLPHAQQHRHATCSHAHAMQQPPSAFGNNKLFCWNTFNVDTKLLPNNSCAATKTLAGETGEYEPAEKEPKIKMLYIYIYILSLFCPYGVIIMTSMVKYFPSICHNSLLVLSLWHHNYDVHGEVVSHLFVITLSLSCPHDVIVVTSKLFPMYLS